MTDFEDLKNKLVEQLMGFDITESEAKEMAKSEVERMGIYRIENGSCPLEQVSPLACTFCRCGHHTDCHHPYTCEEANCSHYQTQLAQEGVE